MIDRLLAVQLANVAAGAVVSLIAMIFLADTDIIASQAIFSAGQIATTALAVTLSTVSLEPTLRLSPRNIIVALFGGGIVWLLLLMPSVSSMKAHFGIAVLFVFSLAVGELSAFPRARIVNSEVTRLSLALVNTLAMATRLASFFVFLALFGTLTSFVLSAGLSNIARAFALFWIARTYLGENTLRPPRLLQLPTMRISCFQRIGAYLDRNPTILVVLAISHTQPVFGLAPSDYALSILIMNFSAAVGAMMWIRFENAAEPITWTVLHPLLLAFVLLFATALAVVYLLPVGLIAANSLTYLISQPVLLILWPILFGLSTGLSVFAYGSTLSFLKALSIPIAFLTMSQYGFFVGMLMNVCFFIFETRKNSRWHLYAPITNEKRGKHY